MIALVLSMLPELKKIINEKYLLHIKHYQGYTEVPTRRYETMEPLGEISRPAKEDSIPDLIAFISEHMKDSGFPDQRMQEIMLSMKEAIGNILRFSCGGGDCEIQIACSLDNAGKLVITISDNGRPFNMLIESDPFLTPDDILTTNGRPSTKVMKRSVGNIECKRYEGKNIIAFTIQKPPAT